MCIHYESYYGLFFSQDVSATTRARVCVTPGRTYVTNRIEILVFAANPTVNVSDQFTVYFTRYFSSFDANES